MTVRARLLLGLIGLVTVVGVIGWLVRFQPFGPGEARGSPLPGGAPAAAGWADAGAAPFARLEMGTAVHDGRFWLAGGFTADGGVVDELAIYSPSTGEWTDGPALPESLHHAALASDGERLYLVGGYTPGGSPTNAVRILDPVAGAWTDGAPLPEPRAAGSLTWDGARLVYAGGVGPEGVSADVFSFADGRWARLGSLRQPREHLAAVSDGAGRTWVMGGRQGGLDRNVGDVELVEEGAIALIAEITPRGGVAAFFHPGFGACLTGGEAPSFAFATVECVDAGGRITGLPDMTQRRHGHGAGVIDGIAYALLGGELPGLHATPTVERLPMD